MLVLAALLLEKDVSTRGFIAELVPALERLHRSFSTKKLRNNNTYQLVLWLWEA